MRLRVAPLRMPVLTCGSDFVNARRALATGEEEEAEVPDNYPLIHCVSAKVIRAKCSGKQSYWCGVDAKATAQAVEQCRHHIRDQSEDGIVWAENLVYRCAVPFVGSSH